jgi:hypothetical protein
MKHSIGLGGLILWILCSAHTVRAAVIKFYVDMQRTSCTANGVGAGETFDIFVYLEGPQGRSYMGASFDVWTIDTGYDRGIYQVVSVEWNPSSYHWGQVGDHGINERGVTLVFPCQEPPLFLMRVTCEAVTPLTCKTFTTRGSVDMNGSGNTGAVAVLCDLERIVGSPEPGPLYIVNPSGAPDCTTCEQPVAATNSTWGSVKALYVR